MQLHLIRHLLKSFRDSLHEAVHSLQIFVTICNRHLTEVRVKGFQVVLDEHFVKLAKQRIENARVQVRLETGKVVIFHPESIITRKIQ